MKHILKTALGLLLGLTLFVCLGACAWAETWNGVINSNTYSAPINGDVTVNGAVTLNLAAGTTLTVNGDIFATGAGNSLTITGGGELVVNADSDNGIYLGGDVTINGGTVTVTAGGGFGICSMNGSVTINGGTVTASGSSYGIYSVDGSVTINGGTVRVSDVNYGIEAQKIMISGGQVTASGKGGAGIYADDSLTIGGGTVTTSGPYVGITVLGSATISGGQVTASGSMGGIYVDGDSITISGGQVTARGSSTYGICSRNGSVTISGGQVKASGGDYGIESKGSVTLSWTNENDFIDLEGNPIIIVAPTLNSAFLDSNSNKVYTSTNASELPGLQAVHLVPGAYTVTWKNEDGTVLETDLNVPYGSTPSYDGPTPTKPGDAQYSYTFAGWSPTVVPVNGDATYTAVFTATPMEPATFTVTYKPGEGSGAEKQYTQNVGETHMVEGNFFTAPEGKTFDDWQGSDGQIYKVGAPVTGSLTLTARWKDTESRSGGGEEAATGGDIVFLGGGFTGADEWDGGYVAPQRAWKVSLAPMVNGSAALGIMTGESTTTDMNVYPTTTIYVFPNPDPGFVLDKIIWSLIDGSASYDITEAKNFVMPAMDAVVYVSFKPAG